MEGSELREAIKQIIADIIQQNQIANIPPLAGQVTSINADGTVDVTTAVGVIAGVSTPRALVMDEQVVVITGGGRQIAV